MLANVGPDALGSSPSSQRRTQDEIRIQQRDPVKLPILPDRIRPSRSFMADHWTVFWNYGETFSLDFRAALTFSIDRRSQKKNQSVLAKNVKLIFSASVLRLPHEVVHQQQLPVVRPLGLHHRNPLPVLQMRFETHMDEERNHTRPEGPAGRQ